jgi:sec-independent protein translocase protein TatB
MFDLFSWNHILILVIVALVVVGPKDLPRLMHMMGRWAGKARGMANEFKRSFDDMARQSELEELRKEVEALKANNPLADIGKSLEEPLYADNSAAMSEPRAGEFQVTDTSLPEAGAPAATPAPETPPSERAAT